MGIEGGKPLNLVSFMMATALGVSAVGCSGAPESGPTKIPTVPATASATAVIPAECTTPAELVRPRGFDKESMITYPGGVIVNQAGQAIDLIVRVPNIIRLNNEASLGLNLTPETPNITYFFAGSFKRPDTIEQVVAFFEQQKSYLLLRYCQEQGSAGGRLRFSAISVADELTEVYRKNPRNYPPTDPFWQSALEIQLTLAYVARTRVNISDPSQIPLEIPQVSAQDRTTITALGLPFSIIKLNPDYFIASGLIEAPKKFD